MTFKSPLRNVAKDQNLSFVRITVFIAYRWPEEHRGKEWVVAQTMCLEAMEGLRDPEQARAAFVAAAIAAEMLMIKEEYIQQRPERRSAKNKRGQRSGDSMNV